MTRHTPFLYPKVITLCKLQSALHIAYCILTLRITLCKLHSFYFTLLIQLRTIHSVYTLYCTMHIAFCILHSAHCTLHITLCTLCCACHSVYCTQHILLSMLQSAHYTLHIVLYTLQSAYCALHILKKKFEPEKKI